MARKLGQHPILFWPSQEEEDAIEWHSSHRSEMPLELSSSLTTTTTTTTAAATSSSSSATTKTTARYHNNYGDLLHGNVYNRLPTSKSPISFWRWYASDLSRSYQTAELIHTEWQKQWTQLDHDLLPRLPSSSSVLHRMPIFPSIAVDPRIRETAKGAHQGYPKSLTYEQAMAERIRVGDTSPIPLYETKDEGLDRVMKWLNDVLHDAILDCEQSTLDNSDRIPHGIKNESSLTAAPESLRRVLAVAHAGISREFLERLLGTNRLHSHPHVLHEPNGRLYIPNTSLTILDIRPRWYHKPYIHHVKKSEETPELEVASSTTASAIVTTLGDIVLEPLEPTDIRIVRLAWTGHL
jgi:broad specificity phosphatase PhoE